MPNLHRLGKGRTMIKWIIAARLTLCIASVVAPVGIVPSSVRAEDGRDWRGHGHNRLQEHTREKWQDHDRYDDYRHRPDVYYSAPPVVVAPRGYYTQPGATLNFNLPFFR
ncbi:MAG: hypothetical protein QOD93_4757 [Acetobacteraceae bacterium]|jgi:hypothetical protein|nr:hypothetical protein [Acetobacteraceae bacterium]